MKTTLALLIVLFAFGGITVAQDSDDINRNEFYAGYLHKRSDDSVFSNGANGYNFGYTRNVSKYIGVRVEAAATFKKTLLDTTLPDGRANFDTRSSFYTYHAGIQIKDNSKSGKLKPFAHALVGVAHDRANFRCTPAPVCAGNVNTFTSKDTGFSAGLGGGLDLRVNDRIDVRVVQAEYNPVSFGGRRINNFRVGFGIVIK